MKDFEQGRKINYAGYGLFADEEFGRILFGEKTPNFAVEQKGYELVVLEFKDLPEDIQKDVPPTFRMYAARKNEYASMRLRVWKLTPVQKELADGWNYGDILYSRETIMFDINQRPIEIDMITNHGIGNIVDGVNYDPYLNDKEIVLNFARESHQASLLNTEGRNSRERMR